MNSQEFSATGGGCHGLPKDHRHRAYQQPSGRGGSLAAPGRSRGCRHTGQELRRLQELLQSGMDIGLGTHRGLRFTRVGRRLNPISMAAAAIIAGLLPVIFGSGTGSEVIRKASPIAAAVVQATRSWAFATFPRPMTRCCHAQ